MPFDLSHFVVRFLSPFNPESRFYWPAVYALLLALAVNVVWYNWRRRATVPENVAKPWAFWINVVFIIWLLALFIAKAPFWTIALSVVANIGLLVYIYEFWLPPHEAAWGRERRRQQYIPGAAGRRKKRRR